MALTLLLIGIGTSIILVLVADRSVDRTLLVAAHTWGNRNWEPEGKEPLINMRIAQPNEVPEGWPNSQDEDPRWFTEGNDRVLLMAVEPDSEIEKPNDEDRKHFVIRAAMPIPRTWDTLMPWVPAYIAVSALTLALAAMAHNYALHRALSPLWEAQAAIQLAPAAQVGTRLPEGGLAEIRDLLSAVNTLLERRDQAMTLQARFTTEAAHELRTPLTALLGALEVALRRPRSAEDYATALKEALADTRELTALVEALLALARVDAGQAEQHRERMGVGEIASEAVAREKPGILSRGGQLQVDIQTEAEVMINHPLMVAALSNLLRNAGIYAPGTEVTLTVVQTEDKVQFIVEDQGKGVQLEDREVLFDRFARRRQKGGLGLGLGLPLTREVARRHGGDCQFEEAPHGRVVLSLPVGAL